MLIKGRWRGPLRSAIAGRAPSVLTVAGAAVALAVVVMALPGCSGVAAELPAAADQPWEPLATVTTQDGGRAGGTGRGAEYERPALPTGLVPPTVPLPGPGTFLPGGSLEAIYQRGYLRVGVSRDTQRFGAWDPVNHRFDGFDVDIAREITAALFGLPSGPEAVDRKTRYVPVSYSERIPAVVTGKVDIVVSTMTYTQARADQVGMSAAYFTAHPRLLSRLQPSSGRDPDTASRESAIDSVAKLVGKRVCAPRSTTTLNNLRRLHEVHGEFEIVDDLNELSDCLAVFQQGEVDVVAANDASLVGMLEQDSTAVLGRLGELDGTEYYSVAFSRGDTELAGFVNGVLERIRRDEATWMRLCEVWQVPEMPCSNAGPPEPQWAS